MGNDLKLDGTVPLELFAGAVEPPVSAELSSDVLPAVAKPLALVQRSAAEGKSAKPAVMSSARVGIGCENIVSATEVGCVTGPLVPRTWLGIVTGAIVAGEPLSDAVKSPPVSPEVLAVPVEPEELDDTELWPCPAVFPPIDLLIPS